MTQPLRGAVDAPPYLTDPEPTPPYSVAHPPNECDGPASCPQHSPAYFAAHKAGELER